MKREKIISCSHISVDCVVNDPVDVRCGGPDFLGFDFFVRQEETDYMKQAIKIALEQFKVPLRNMYVVGIVNKKESEVWTRNKIVRAIASDAEYLQFENSRNYGSSG